MVRGYEIEPLQAHAGSYFVRQLRPVVHSSPGSHEWGSFLMQFSNQRCTQPPTNTVIKIPVDPASNNNAYKIRRRARGKRANNQLNTNNTANSGETNNRYIAIQPNRTVRAGDMSVKQTGAVTPMRNNTCEYRIEAASDFRITSINKNVGMKNMQTMNSPSSKSPPAYIPLAAAASAGLFTYCM